MNGNNYFPSSNFPGLNFDNNTLSNGEDINNYNSQDNWFGNNNIEETYIENILKLNRGKKAKIYVTIPGSKDSQDKVFEGIIEQVGKDHIVVSNPTTGIWSLVLLPYLTYISFDESINYNK